MAIKSLICAAYTVLAIAVPTAHASPMLQKSGQDILGVTGIEFNGGIYNAEFLDGTFHSLYSTDSTIDYSFAFADAATSALYQFIATLALDSYQPDDFRGCTSAVACALDTANYYLPAVNVVNGKAVIVRADNVPYTATRDSVDTETNFMQVSFVSWTRVSAVPEPPVALLLVTGLIVFGVTRVTRRA